jgi:3-keto-disaccharide hydrolase
MTRWVTLAIGALASCAFPVTGPAQAQTGEGWTTLFDGRDLSNWQGDGNAQFAIEDGAIVAKGKTDPKDTAFLISKDKYKDFQIYAELWVSNDANSGIFIRCEDPKKPGAKTCYECNVYDTRPDPSYGTGAIVYHAEVNPMPKAGGKWSIMEITAKGRDLSVKFDGKETVHVRNGEHTEGPFALQFGEGTVKFRKVAIKSL